MLFSLNSTLILEFQTLSYGLFCLVFLCPFFCSAFVMYYFSCILIQHTIQTFSAVLSKDGLTSLIFFGMIDMTGFNPVKQIYISVPIFYLYVHSPLFHYLSSYSVSILMISFNLSSLTQITIHELLLQLYLSLLSPFHYFHHFFLFHNIHLHTMIPTSSHFCFDLKTICNILNIHHSVQFNHSVMSDSLQLHGWQHTRLPCPPPTPRAYSKSGCHVSDDIQ